MGRTLLIGQTCCYWPKGADKPLAAMCLDCDGLGNATLAVFTVEGGRFVKTVGPKDSRNGEGWGGVGQIFH